MPKMAVVSLIGPTTTTDITPGNLKKFLDFVVKYNHSHQGDKAHHYIDQVMVSKAPSVFGPIQEATHLFPDVVDRVVYDRHAKHRSTASEPAIPSSAAAKGDYVWVRLYRFPSYSTPTELVRQVTAMVVKYLEEHYKPVPLVNMSEMIKIYPVKQHGWLSMYADPGIAKFLCTVMELQFRAASGSVMSMAFQSQSHTLTAQDYSQKFGAMMLLDRAVGSGLEAGSGVVYSGASCSAGAPGEAATYHFVEQPHQ